MKVGAKFAAHLSLRTLDHVPLSSSLEEKAVTLAIQNNGLRIKRTVDQTHVTEVACRFRIATAASIHNTSF
ncbi:hypothetical protein Rcae01_06309 [Novipirellula caenicola]|uniref:Uncharacterized protein n=1 Tax=Novipirellula caenicola TaxID=1536901 RepID=A0ABP9W099_9BACT